MSEYEKPTSSFHAITFEEATGERATISTLVPDNTCIGDANVDYDVDGLDLSDFIAAYIIEDEDADLNRDDFVDWKDVEIFAESYGKNCS